MYYVSVAFGYSSVFAVIIGLIRFKRIHPSYQPFVYLACLDLLNQGLSHILIQLFRTNAVNGNCYVLLDCYLFAWLFKNWGEFRFKSWQFPALLTFMTLIWIYDNFILNNITTLNSLFRICYSFVLIFLAINQLNKLIVQERANLLRNAKFLICIGVCIFYSYKATIEVFYLIRLQASDSFYNNVFLILILVNIFVNLIYALAALWMPTKQKFTLSY